MTTRTRFRKCKWARIPLVLLVYLCYLAALPGLVHGAPIPLATEGTATATIVVSTNPAPSVVFAAAELKHYLDAITGGRFVVTNTLPASGCAIVLGDTKYTREAGIDVDKLERDQFVISAGDARIFIAGKDETSEKAQTIFLLNNTQEDIGFAAGKALLNRAAWDFEKATLYGVYRFLEDLGVRWFFPGPKGEVVPRKPTLVLDLPEYYSDAPAYLMRRLGYYSIPSNHVKVRNVPTPVPNEYIELGWTDKRNRLWEIRHGGGSQVIAVNHYPTRAQFKERFAEPHPEYFALLADGHRDLPENLADGGYRYHLCYSHPGGRRETVRDIEAYFAGQPSSARGIAPNIRGRFNQGWAPGTAANHTFSVTPHDSFRRCRCENCEKLFFQDIPYAGRDSDLVFAHVAHVANAVKTAWPDKRIVCLAYGTYSLPPATMTSLPDNVIVGMSASGGVAAPFTNVSAERYGQYIRLLEEWNAYNEQPLAVWLRQLYRQNRPNTFAVPMYMPHHLARTIRDTARYAKYAFIQMDHDSIFYEHINRYVMQKTLWNPDLDVDDLLDDYITTFYGPDAFPFVKELFTDLERTCMQIAEAGSGRLAIYEKYFSAERIQTYRSLYGKALDAVRDDQYAERVRYIDKYLIRGIENGFKEFEDRLRKAKTTLTTPIYRAPAAIEIDGKIDPEEWSRSKVFTLVNNVDGEQTQWPTEVRALYDADTLYFAFDCFAPNMEAQTDREDYESVEVFIDNTYDKDSYHQLLITSNGDVRDWYFEESAEPGDLTWSSGARTGITRHEKGWSIEIALPLAALHGKTGVDDGAPWGINFCRSVPKPPRPKDRFSTYSGLIQGKFAQPDLFSRLFFLQDPPQTIPEADVDGNLLSDGSFEQWGDEYTPQYWHAQNRGQCRIFRDSAVVHSGQYSARMELDGAGWCQLRKTLYTQHVAETGFREHVEPGKYRLTFYWYSTSGTIRVSLRYPHRGEDGAETAFLIYDPHDEVWVSRRNWYPTLRGKPNQWNKTTIEFDNRFPQVPVFGYLIFFGTDKMGGTLFLDDVSLEKVTVHGAQSGL